MVGLSESSGADGISSTSADRPRKRLIAALDFSLHSALSRKSQVALTIAILVLFILSLSLASFYAPASRDNSKSYSFIVAGHTYGAHDGENTGLYPKFLNHLNKNSNHDAELIILTGDIVRKSIPQSWDQAIKELKSLTIPYFLVMGNHDSSDFGRTVFQDLYGRTYYSFNQETETFIVLDGHQLRGSIPPNQIRFLKQTIEKNPDAQTYFIFIHELIWTAHTEKYENSYNNYGTYNRVFKSNFWSQVAPVFRQFPQKNFYLFAGDLGAALHSAPAFYDKVDNLTLIASGMGEIRDENYLLVTVRNAKPFFRLIGLNRNNKLSSLKKYQVRERN